jgi:diguanylate cyclase (GGDEF)-like protein/PAS domain S-box-containing protein
MARMDPLLPSGVAASLLLFAVAAVTGWAQVWLALSATVLAAALAGTALRMNRRAAAAGATVMTVSESESRLRALIEHAPGTATVLSDSGLITYQARSVARMLGHEAARMVGTPFLSYVHTEDQPVSSFPRDLAPQPGSSSELAWRVRHRDGTWRHLEITVTNLTHEAGVRGFVLSSRDESERRGVERRLRHQARHDALTGLVNRATFVDAVQRELVGRDRQVSLMAVLFLDLDDFKNVNDSLGHNTGDELLRAVAQRLRGAVSSDDIVARLGGDEFAILLRNLHNREDAEHVAERLLEATNEPFALADKSMNLRTSVGIATSDTLDGYADEFLRNADVAMYAAKAQGKGCYATFDPSMHMAAMERLQLKNELHRAIEQRTLSLDYQPVVDLRSGAVHGVEALARWTHPQLGPIKPDRFIPLAEETGLIIPLGRWVLEEACAQARSWQLANPRHEGLFVSVNLSSWQLRDPNLVQDVSDVLRQTGLSPASLMLELTESGMLDDIEPMVEQLGRLRALGLQIAIDDFGTGYSSLSYLRRLPIDVLKIDRSFVEGIGDARQALALARTIIDLANVLELQTVAEGIELLDQRTQLTSLGCDLGQGFHFARPIDVPGIDRLLAARPGVEPTKHLRVVHGADGAA